MERYGVRGGEWSCFKSNLLAEGRGHVWERRNENGLMIRWMYLRDQSWVCLLLYAICVNNLPESVEQRQVKQYADDTAMFQSPDSVSELEVVLRASPLPHGGKGMINWVFKCCPLHSGYCTPIRAQYSVIWDVAAPNTHLTTKCEIDCHSGSAENCSLEVARSTKTWKKSRY